MLRQDTLKTNGGEIITKSTWLRRQKLVDANTGLPTNLTGEQLNSAKTKRTVITRSAWLQRQKLVDADTGLPTNLTGEQLNSAKTNRTVITKSTWRQRQKLVDADTGQLKNTRRHKRLRTGQSHTVNPSTQTFFTQPNNDRTITTTPDLISELEEYLLGEDADTIPSQISTQACLKNALLFYQQPLASQQRQPVHADTGQLENTRQHKRLKTGQSHTVNPSTQTFFTQPNNDRAIMTTSDLMSAPEEYLLGEEQVTKSVV